MTSAPDESMRRSRAMGRGKTERRWACLGGKAFHVGLFACLVAACGGGDGASSGGDPLGGCGLPDPCALGKFTQGSNRELLPQDAATCMYTTLAAAKPAHLAVQFHDLTDTTWDFYSNGKDPAVIVETECELNGGPCSVKHVKRCDVKTAQLLDCSHGQGPTRVCGDPTNDWCQSSREVDQEACP